MKKLNWTGDLGLQFRLNLDRHSGNLHDFAVGIGEFHHEFCVQNAPSWSKHVRTLMLCACFLHQHFLVKHSLVEVVQLNDWMFVWH